MKDEPEKMDAEAKRELAENMGWKAGKGNLRPDENPYAGSPLEGAWLRGFDEGVRDAKEEAAIFRAQQRREDRMIERMEKK